MRRPVAFDLSRLFVGAAGRTPRGIDRIDMGYARRFLGAMDASHVGLVPSVRRMGVLHAGEARRLAQLVEDHWRENSPAGEDLGHDWLLRRLAGHATGPAPVPARSPSAPTATAGRYLRLFAQARRSALRGAAHAVPQNSLYINVGQVLLGWPWFFDWLDARPDVKPVFMMHDLIPIVHPEYSGPILTRHHARAVQTVARRAAAMIATSHASAAELRDAVARLGRTDLPFHVVPLPIDASLLTAPGPAGPPTEPYFVTVGIIDQRKNHRLLLHVWRDMIRRGDAAMPKLVIVGSRGLRTAEIVDMLRRSPGLADHVIEVNGLSSPALRELIRGARAVLMPSFTEGFGLPVVEALALCTPVIASDIPAHREVGGSFATYLDPLDGIAWRNEILARVAADASADGQRRQALATYHPQTWSSYFDAVMPFLASL